MCNSFEYSYKYVVLYSTAGNRVQSAARGKEKKKKKKPHTGSCQLAFKSYGVLSEAIRYVSRSLRRPSESYACLVDSRIFALGPRAFRAGVLVEWRTYSIPISGVPGALLKDVSATLRCCPGDGVHDLRSRPLGAPACSCRARSS